MKSFVLIFLFLISYTFLNAQVKQVNRKDNKSISLPVRTKIDQSKLLLPIKDNIAKSFPGAKILIAYKNEAKGVVTYSVQVMFNVTKWTLIYDSKGKYIKKEEITTPSTVSPVPTK